MDDRRPLPQTADSAVMSEYFETMRQFLETQERVMTAFMGGQPSERGVRPAALRSRPAPMTLPRVSEVAPVAMQVTAPPFAPPAPVMPAPAAAPVIAKTAAAPQPAPAPASASLVAAVPVKPAATPAAAAVSRDKMIDLLLSIVEEKTGYPKDMVGLDQNLESDLGIDSIKRIEVVGALLQTLPEPYRLALAESRSKLNTQATLNGMLQLLEQTKVGGGATVPFDLAGTGKHEVVDSSLPSRHLIRPVMQEIAASAAKRLQVGRFIVAGKACALRNALIERLVSRACVVETVEMGILADEGALLEWCSERKSTPLAGLIHLAGASGDAVAFDAGVSEWRAHISVQDKSLFLLMRELGAGLVNDAHVLSVSGMGGQFGRGSVAAPLTLHGGAVGMLKSLHEERPALRVKAIDIDPSLSAETNVARLISEIELDGGRQEVGYPLGQRTEFHTVAVPADDPAAGAEAMLNDFVVLATGGARGITAEVLRELARPGNTLVLTGRSPLPEAEPPEVAALASAQALRNYFIDRVRRGESSLKPAEIQRQVQQLVGSREIRANIADFQQAGATVEYHPIDVTDEAAMCGLLSELYERHGRIDGVVHGAGVIEDKLLADKTSESWSRVVETKVIGLLLLQKYLRPASLKFLSVFSSVAGRYGNSGQSDYATANELMNRVCEHLRGRWGGGVNVNALCWGPWGATKFGAGMVTAETEAKFAAKGVLLVTAVGGRQLFRDELIRAANDSVEVICGVGPWEQREAELGLIRHEPPPAGSALGPLLGNANVVARSTGDQLISFQLDRRHAYLQDHVFDGTPILPAAVALEMLAEAAVVLWPGWKVVEVRDHKLMKGVELKSQSLTLSVLISPPPYGSSEGFEVNAALQSSLGDGRALTHYRAVVRLEQQLPLGDSRQPRLHREKQVSAAHAYRNWLSHGPRFQLIDEIDGMSSLGSASRVRSTHPSSWLEGSAADSPGWCFDPGLLDAAAQMAWAWARAFRDETALPVQFGRVVRYRDNFPPRVHMEFQTVNGGDGSVVCANVAYFDEAGEAVMLIEDLRSIASAALNRLGGTAFAAAQG